MRKLFNYLVTKGSDKLTFTICALGLVLFMAGLIIPMNYDYAFERWQTAELIGWILKPLGLIMFFLILIVAKARSKKNDP